jgi:hypothetical protein
MANEVTIIVKAHDRTKGALSGIKNNFEQMVGELKGLAIVAGGAVGQALVGPIGVAVAGLAAEFAGAGAALGAFGAAIKPQASAIQDLVAASDAYDKAVMKSGKDSAEAQKNLHLYNALLKKMPPATADAAMGFFDLRKTFNKWSDSLTSTTMPMFTRGMKDLQGVIPRLTPLVKVAASALDGFLASIERGASGGTLDRVISELTLMGQESLPHLLNALKNTVVGVGAFLGAFMSVSDGSLSRGLEHVTERFANWAKSLRGNEKFNEFVQRMKDQLPGIIDLLGNLIQTVGTLSIAMAPFSGATLKIAEAFARLINAAPQELLNELVPAIAGVILATRTWAAAQASVNALYLKNPVGATIAAVVALGIAFTVAFQKVQGFRNAVTDSMVYLAQATIRTGEIITNVILTAFDGIVQGAAKAFGWIPGIGPRIKRSAKDIDDWKNSVVGSFDHASDAVERWGERVKAAGKTAQAKIKLKADISDLNSKLDTAEESLRKANGKIATANIKANINDLEAKYLLSIRKLNTLDNTTATSKLKGHITDLQVKIARAKSLINSVPKSKQSQLRAYIAQLEAQVKKAKSVLNSLHGRTVDVNVRARIDPRLTSGGFVMGGRPVFTGGIIGAASGGPRSRQTLVGEHGPELVDLAPGSTVHSNPDTRRLMGTGGGGGHLVLEFAGGSGSELERLLWDFIKKNVRLRGGKGPNSVQKALGGGR